MSNEVYDQSKAIAINILLIIVFIAGIYIFVMPMYYGDTEYSNYGFTVTHQVRANITEYPLFDETPDIDSGMLLIRTADNKRALYVYWHKQGYPTDIESSLSIYLDGEISSLTEPDHVLVGSLEEVTINGHMGNIQYYERVIGGKSAWGAYCTWNCDEANTVYATNVLSVDDDVEDFFEYYHNEFICH